MSDPISCNVACLPVRPENLDPDWIVTLAANLARVEDRCEPVAAPGPSYEEVRRAQHGAVGEPVETLVRRFDRASANDWFEGVQNLAGLTKRGVGQAVRVERVVEAILSNAVAEGQELKLARIRDAKVATVLSLGASALDANFLSAELRERTRSLGEAALVLARIDAVPGLRAAVSTEIRRAIEAGRALVTSEALCSQAGLDAFVETATALGERVERGEALTPREQFVLDSVNRFRTDTAFRIGMEEALTRGQRAR
jgi:hypothetical protein